MKFVISVLLAAVIAASFTACGKNKTSTGTAEQTTAAEITAEADTETTEAQTTAVNAENQPANTAEENTPAEDSAAAQADAPETQTILVNFITEFTNGNFDNMYAMTHDEYRYFDGVFNTDSAASMTLYYAILQNLSVDITSVEENTDTANVYTHIKTLNMYNILVDIQKNADTDDAVNAMLEKHKDDFSETDTVFNFVKQNGEWKIESNIGIYSDLTGGYVQYINEITMFGATAEEIKQRYADN